MTKVNVMKSDGSIVEVDSSTVFTPIPPPIPPTEISDRQFAHGLWKQGIITLPEAKAFVKTGTIPAQMQALIDAMPVEVRDDVELLVSGATTFNRTHPFTKQLATAFGWTEAQMNAFWLFCSEL